MAANRSTLSCGGAAPYQVGIEMGSRLLPYDLKGPVLWDGRLVAPLGDQGVKHVRNRHDPGAERYGFARKAIRIAGAVPALMG